MAYQPATHQFTYKKLQPPPSSLNVTFGDTLLTNENTRNYKIKGVPNWLQVANVIFNASTKQMEFVVSVKPAVIEGMAPGFYNANLKASFEWENIVFWMEVTDPTGIPITLEVKDTVVLSVAPSTIVWEYIVGGTLPQSKIVQIVSENSWNITKDQSWVTLSLTNGVNSGNVVIGADVTGLPIGNHSAIVTVDDGIYIKNIVLTLTVSEGDTEVDYLQLSPRNFSFVSEFGEVNANQKPLSLDVSHAWSTVISESWLNLNTESGAAGLFSLNLSVDSDALAVGNYTAEIEFSTATIVKKIFVLLKVVEFYTQGIESGALYFADDRNKLEATSIDENSFLVIDAITSLQERNVPYQLEAPYFQGVAKIVLGEETEDILKSIVPTSNFTSRVLHNILPTAISLTMLNENKATGAVTQIAQFQNVRFLTGKTPTTVGKISYIPSVVYVTKNAVLAISTTLEPTDVSITTPLGSFTIVQGLALNLYTYTALINLADYTLAPGDEVTIEFSGFTVTAVIKPTQAETTRFAFENEWREYEIIEATGFLTKRATANQTTTEIQDDAIKTTKIVSIEKGVEYTINTGWLYSQDEVNWWAKILESKRVFIYENGVPIEIYLTTKKLEIYKTRNTLRSFNLKFKKAAI